MIKIKIEAQSGADLRAQLIALLGGLDGQIIATTTGDHSTLLSAVNKAVNQEAPAAPAPAMEIVKDEAKQTTSKKPTKKELDKIAADEAAKNAEATQQEAGSDDTPAEEVKPEENGEVKVDLNLLREMVLRLSRQGKKEETKAEIVKFKVERITELAEDQHVPFYEAIKPMYDALPPEA